jgi:hypothetical protein
MRNIAATHNQKVNAMRAAAAILIATLVAATPLFAQDDDDDDEDATLGAVVKSAPVTLEQGFRASNREGPPISGKFEFEVDGAQLSVYTARGDAFSEVIVDHRSGAISKVIPISTGNDLAEAKQQMSVMRGADRSLDDATVAAVKMHPGYRAVSAMPASKNGVPLAKVVLTNGSEWKTVYAPLNGASQ